jgi:hypothetical protein
VAPGLQRVFQAAGLHAGPAASFVSRVDLRARAAQQDQIVALKKSILTGPSVDPDITLRRRDRTYGNGRICGLLKLNFPGG